MQVVLNGEPREIPDNLSLEALVGYLQLKVERVAIERNREIIKRERWSEVQVAPGDELEIVHLVGGG